MASHRCRPKRSSLSLVASWGEARVGASGRVFTPGQHMMPIESSLQDEIVGFRTTPVLWLLPAAVGLRAARRVRQSRQPPAGARPTSDDQSSRCARPWAPSQGGCSRRFTVEGLVLSLLGAALGLGLARAGEHAPYASPVQKVFPVFVATAVDPAVTRVEPMPAACRPRHGVGVRACLPLLQVPAPALGAAAEGCPTRSGATSARRVRRRRFVAGEVALAVVLVGGAAGLMMRTVLNLMNVDAGFDRSHLVAFGVALPAASYSTFDQQVQVLSAFGRSIGSFDAGRRQRIDRVPGLPPQRRGRTPSEADVEDCTPHPDVLDVVDFYQTVTAGYFEAMRIPIMRGRVFREGNRTGAPSGGRQRDVCAPSGKTSTRSAGA